MPGPCGLLLILVSLLPLGAADLRIGTASVVITPPAGMPMAGSYSLRVSEGVLDDLHTKALVLEKDGVRAALVACDLIAVSDEVVSEARQLIEQNTGIPGSHVMISATHTHSGPFMPGRASFDKYFGGEMEVSRQFRLILPGQIAESVRKAAEHVEPAVVMTGALDLVSIPERFVAEARRRIESRKGIPGKFVMISATHSHTGPEMGARLKGVDAATEKIATNYHKALSGWIAESVAKAVADLQPAQLSTAVGHEDSIRFIRRFRMKDGRVGWNPGKLNPDIVHPIGAIDPDVPVV